MSISDDDILQAIAETFRVESDEHIQSINRLLLRLEQGVVDDVKATLDEIAREAHTLKGASSILGLDVVQSTAHAMESVFDALRDADRQAPVELYDLLYDALDRLSVACRRVIDPTGDGAEALARVSEACLRYAEEAAGDGETAPAADPPVPQAIEPVEDVAAEAQPDPAEKPNEVEPAAPAPWWPEPSRDAAAEAGHAA